MIIFSFHFQNISRRQFPIGTVADRHYGKLQTYCPDDYRQCQVSPISLYMTMVGLWAFIVKA